MGPPGSKPRSRSRGVAAAAACTACLVSLGVLGCAARKPTEPTLPRSGTVEIEVLPPPDIPPPPPGYRASAYVPVIPPQTVERPLPVYPRSALADEVAGTATLLYHVETDGSATLVRLIWNPAPPEEHVASFESAVEEAVARWEFVPARRLVRKELPGGSMRVDEQAIPKAGRVLIRFRVVEGEAIVD